MIFLFNIFPDLKVHDLKFTLVSSRRYETAKGT